MTPFWVRIDEVRRVAIVPRPRGGDWLEDELFAIKEAGVDLLVSMLTSQESRELGLDEESASCRKIGLEFRSFPINDRETPESIAEVRGFVSALRKALDAGRSVATHCRASIGRSSLVLACLLVDEGLSVEKAFAQLSSARGTRVPDTAEQVRWVERYAESSR
jgi:protein-tyrosine phosphatase